MPDTASSQDKLPAKTAGEFAPVLIEHLAPDLVALPEAEAQSHILAILMGKVYEAAPAPMRPRLLEQLLRPVGVLSVVAIANGVFARLRFHTGWPQVPLSAGDVQSIGTDDIIALAYRLVQIGGEALNGVTQLLTDSPALAGSAAAAVLLTLLLGRAQCRREDDDSGLLK